MRRFEAQVGKTISEDGARRLLFAYRGRHAAIAPGFKIKPGFILTSCRSISARINQNYDAWPSDELKKSYRSFVGKPIFVNHTNEDPSKARGVVVAARYVDAGNGDRYIETIMEVDAKRFPKLAHEIRTGGMDSVSMGVEAGFTKCSICENRATDVWDMCNHIKFHKGEYMKNSKTGKRTRVYENCFKLGFFELSYVFDPADETAVVSRVIAASKKTDELPVSPESAEWYETPKKQSGWQHNPEGVGEHHEEDHGWGGRLEPDPDAWEDEKTVHSFKESWYRLAFGETEAPEDVDTLRDESEDDTDDWHHWVESPEELRTPDFDKSKRLDRDQEDEGLDRDRRAEDAEEYGAPGEKQRPEEHDEYNDSPMPINPPASKKGRRTRNHQGVQMSRSRNSRYYYAADDDEDTGDEGGADSQDVDELVGEAEQDLEDFENEESGGGDGSDEGSDEDDSEGYGDEGGEEEPEEDESEPESDETDENDSGSDHSDQPPWLQEGRRTVSNRRSRKNKRSKGRTVMAGSNLSQRARVASQRRHADDNGFTDGGPYGRNDLGEQEDVFISDVPGAEAVDAPTGDESKASNSPEALVASRNFDPSHYQRLADVVAALPPAQRRAVAEKMVRTFKADNGRFNELTFYKAAKVKLVRSGNRLFFAEDLEDPDKVDPPLSGTDVQDLKCDSESLALDDVETQPKDASIHAFRVFDSWLAKATGRTARQHANANFIRRAAAKYAASSRNPEAALQGLFPTLEYVLREARKFEGSAMHRRAEDQSLEVAAPDGRVDVEAPVKNVSDEEAQASQFDLGDFADNAGDAIADPELDVVDGMAGTWTPDKGKESSIKLATGVEAVRCAEAHIAAMPQTYSVDDKWKLTAQFETLRQAVVRDRTRLCEAVIADRKKTARKVAAAPSRGTKGLPSGLGSGTRTASTQRVAASDPDTDSLMFFS